MYLLFPASRVKGKKTYRKVQKYAYIFLFNSISEYWLTDAHILCLFCTLWGVRRSSLKYHEISKRKKQQFCLWKENGELLIV